MTWVPDLTKGQFLDFHMEPVRLVGDKPYIAYRRTAGEASPSFRWIDVIAPLEGDTITCVRWDGYDKSLPCGIPETDVGEFGFAIESEYSTADSGTHPTDNIMLWGSWSTPSALKTKVGDDKAFGTGFAFLGTSVGAKRIYFGTNRGESIGLIDVESGALQSPGMQAASPIASVGGAFAINYGTPVGLIFVADDGTFSRVLTVPSGRTPANYAVDRSSGNALVWIESDEFTFANANLYTSPFATSAGALVPRKVVAGIPFVDPYMTVNAGMALTTIDERSLRLTRLSEIGRTATRPVTSSYAPPAKAF